MSKEVMELALEALETVVADVKTTPTAYEAQRQAITALRKALAEQPCDMEEMCLNCQPRGPNGECPDKQPAQQALDKMAENAREIGLDYEPVQQEPVGSVYRYGKDSSGKQWHGIRWTASGLDLPDGTLIYTSPPAQRTWVGLTDEERDDLLDTYITAEGRARAIEAAHNIKENT